MHSYRFYLCTLDNLFCDISWYHDHGILVSTGTFLFNIQIEYDQQYEYVLIKCQKPKP